MSKNKALVKLSDDHKARSEGRRRSDERTVYPLEQYSSPEFSASYQTLGLQKQVEQREERRGGAGSGRCGKVLLMTHKTLDVAHPALDVGRTLPQDVGPKDRDEAGCWWKKQDVGPGGDLRDFAG